MMADLDRITELLLSDEEMPDVYYSMLENASDTEPTLDPNSLEALIANRQSQGELLMNMAMGPKNISKSAIQRFIPRPRVEDRVNNRADLKKLVRKFINPKTGKLEDDLFYAGRPSAQTPERIFKYISDERKRPYFLDVRRDGSIKKVNIPTKRDVVDLDDLKTFNPYGPKDVKNYYMSNPIKEMLMPYSRRVKITRETGIDPLSPRGPYRNIDAEADRLLKELMK